MLLFKAFEKYNINTFQAIIVNYYTCVLVGLPLLRGTNTSIENISWLPVGILLGVLFIGLFFLIGVTAQKSGVAVASVSMKLGYVLPIALAFFIYNESFTGLKITGILLTVLAVVLSSYPGKNQAEKAIHNSMLFPLIIFIGSGIADSAVQFAEKKYFSNGGFEFFNVILFGTAATIGLIIYIFKSVKKGKFILQKKDIFAGILLGHSQLWFYLFYD